MSAWRARGYVPDSDDEDQVWDDHVEGPLSDVESGREEDRVDEKDVEHENGSSVNGGKLEEVEEHIAKAKGHERAARDEENDSGVTQQPAQDEDHGLVVNQQAARHEEHDFGVTRQGARDEERDFVVTGKLPRIKTYRSRYKHSLAQEKSNPDMPSSKSLAPGAVNSATKVGNSVNSATDVGNFFPSSPVPNLPQSSPLHPERHHPEDDQSSHAAGPLLDPSTNVGNFFPSSGTTQLLDLVSLERPAISRHSDQRRASIGSSDLSDVDMDIVASSPILSDHQVSTSAQVTLHDYDQLAAPTRHLRTRKAIQLHPYLLEQEKYRQALKARGYRPVQVATSQQRVRDDVETQDRDFATAFSTENTQETTPPDSSEPSSQVQTVPTRARPALLRLDDSSDEEVEFAQYDIDRHVAGAVQNPFKRQKTVETPAGSTRGQILPSSTFTATGKLRSLGLYSRTTSISDGPPTPPRTSSPLHVHLDPARVLTFRRPRGLTPPRAASSTPSSPQTRSRKLTRLLPELSESSDSEQSTVRSTSPDPQAEAKHLKRLQKRIKGVLPASWLKLDRKTQTKPSVPVHTHAEQAPLPSGPIRGVAQRVSHHVGPSPRNDRARIVLSDDSDTSDGPSRELPRMQLAEIPFGSHQRIISNYLADNDDLEEYDEIDRMFATTKTSRPFKSKSKKQQSRITDSFVRPEGGAQPQPPAVSKNTSGTARSRKQLKTKSKTSTKRQKPVKLSILDIAGGPNASEIQKPQFLRLAARQARKRPDLGRHSPTRKAIRLATHQDTLDAHAVLQSWNDGHLHPATLAEHDLNDRESEQATSVTTSRTIRRALARATIGIDRSGDINSPRRLEQRKPRPKDVHVAPSRVRPGQLETSASKNAVHRDFLTFAPPPSRLMEIFRKDRTDGAPSRFRLERFLNDHADDQGVEGSGPGVGDADMDDIPAPALAFNGSRSSRKRPAQRIDVEMRSFRQPIEPVPSDIPIEVFDEVDMGAPIRQEPEMATLHGLGPYGTRYPTDFDVRPLELGTHFHASTFIGSDDFAKSLNFNGRDLDLSTGRSTVEFCELTLSYGAWDEEMSSGLDKALDLTTKRMQCLQTTSESDETIKYVDTISRVADGLRSWLACFTRSLHFIDAADRAPFVNHMSQFLDDFLNLLQELPRVSLNEDPRKRPLLDCLLYLLCLGSQASLVSQHSAVDSQTRGKMAGQIVKISRKAVTLCFRGHLLPLREYLEDHRRLAIRETGIQEHRLAVKCVVIVHHVLQSNHSATTLSGILFEQADALLKSRADINYFDQVWYDAFTLQPFLEIDAHGTFRLGSRYHHSNDHWEVVKGLLQRLFQLYPASSQAPNPTLNDYVRACLSRVYILISRWSWRRCDVILNVMYDFFASKGFAQLHQERGTGSPAFLEELDKQSPLDLAAGDTAFHIFLRILVIGLQALQLEYPKNKIRGIAWRFIPNHGRTYRKDQEVTQSDLDALRNNHDLLCTLYWVLPQGSGPRLQMIQNLVDHVSSHREACRLSARAWGTLAKFQMSTGKRFADMESLAGWFREMVSITISQYRLARSEAEAQLAAERIAGDSSITQEMVEMTIAANQRGILAILLDLLQALDRAVKVSITWEISRDLVQSCGLTEVFRLFDPDQTRVFAPIIQALDTIQVLHRDRPQRSAESQQEAEDSQEYGDWSHLAETVPGDTNQDRETSISRTTEFAFLHEPMGSLLSSAFGADRSPHDDLLKKLVQVWTLIATEHVKAGVHGWSSYLDAYSSSSWFQLRSTDQTRKYTAFFLSTVLEADKTAVEEYRSTFLSRWLVGLLERESMLKFQHILTGSLMSSLPTEPLLQNLPFASNRTGRFEITLADLRERRTSLIDSILFNMHADHSRAIMLQASSSTQSGSALALKSEYEEMLKQAMSFMRSVYEVLQRPFEDGSDELAQGAYVSFAQHVVSLMQQYTSDICKIDKFFVDSSVFPLPSNDPTYVVGRLKRYAFKLGDSRARKELAVFINTVSERAAIDDEQVYLVKQVHEAMTGKLSDDLRGFLLTSILPAYIDAAHSTSHGWCLATPLIRASALVFQDLLHHIRPEIEGNLAINIDSMTTTLYHLRQGTLRVAEHPLLLLQPEILHLLTASLAALRSTLTFADYVKRTHGHIATHLVRLVRSFVQIAGYLVSLLRGDEDVLPPDLTLDLPVPANAQYKDTADFSRKALLEGLSRWTERGGKCVVVHGNSVREVRVANRLGSMEVEREAAVSAMDEVLEDYEIVFRRRRGKEGVATAGLDEIFI